MPWGKYKGVRIRLLPNDYLSWLTTTDILKARRWGWLRESLLAELRFRGFNVGVAVDVDVDVDVNVPLDVDEGGDVDGGIGRVKRRFRFKSDT